MAISMTLDRIEWDCRRKVQNRPVFVFATCIRLLGLGIWVKHSGE